MLTVFSLLLTTTVQLSVSWEPENKKDRTTDTKNQDACQQISFMTSHYSLLTFLSFLSDKIKVVLFHVQVFILSSEYSICILHAAYVSNKREDGNFPITFCILLWQ